MFIVSKDNPKCKTKNAQGYSRHLQNKRTKKREGKMGGKTKREREEEKQ